MRQPDTFWTRLTLVDTSDTNREPDRVTPYKIGNIDLDNIRSISGPDNIADFVRSKAGVPSVAIDVQPAIPIPDLTSDRHDAGWFGCTVRMRVLSPQRGDAGKALVVREDGSTIFAGTTDGVAACQDSRLIMDGKLYQGRSARPRPSSPRSVRLRPTPPRGHAITRP